MHHLHLTAMDSVGERNNNMGDRKQIKTRI